MVGFVFGFSVFFKFNLLQSCSWLRLRTFACWRCCIRTFTKACRVVNYWNLKNSTWSSRISRNCWIFIRNLIMKCDSGEKTIRWSDRSGICCCRLFPVKPFALEFVFKTSIVRYTNCRASRGAPTKSGGYILRKTTTGVGVYQKKAGARQQVRFPVDGVRKEEIVPSIAAARYCAIRDAETHSVSFVTGAAYQKCGSGRKDM